jgi:polysaccharide export outer membrane protein
MRVFLMLVITWGLTLAAAAQTLQPGDTIAISVYQDPKLDRQIVIGPTGTFSFPLAGRITAQGLTPEGLEKSLRSKLKDKYTTTPDVTVALVATAKSEEEEKPRFFITGEVGKPGPFLLTQGTSVMQAIAMAGGLGPFAARTRIQIRRKINGADTTFLFDYSAFEKGDDVSGDIELQPGDVVIVPQKGLFE